MRCHRNGLRWFRNSSWNSSWWSLLLMLLLFVMVGPNRNGSWNSIFFRPPTVVYRVLPSLPRVSKRNTLRRLENSNKKKKLGNNSVTSFDGGGGGGSIRADPRLWLVVHLEGPVSAKIGPAVDAKWRHVQIPRHQFKKKTNKNANPLESFPCFLPNDAVTEASPSMTQ